MKTKYACCERCNDIIGYHEFDNGDTDFPRGTFLVCGNKYDALTTGFKTEEDAKKYLKERIAALEVKEGVALQPTTSPYCKPEAGQTA